MSLRVTSCHFVCDTQIVVVFGVYQAVAITSHMRIIVELLFLNTCVRVRADKSEKSTRRKVTAFRLYDQRPEVRVCVCVGVDVAVPLFVSVCQRLNGV